MMTDMTKGSPAKLILAFTIPILIGNLFQQFYSMVDTAIVGQFVGVGALAGRRYFFSSRFCKWINAWVFSDCFSTLWGQ